MASEEMEKKLRKLQLIEAEKKVAKLKPRSSTKSREGKLQAVGKLLLDKPAKTEHIEQTLGKLWCPHEGIECKDLGKNRFLFIFSDLRGKRRAIIDGPWMFNKELVIVEEFDAKKAIDEYEFKLIPIWTRVYGLPMGYLNEESGMEIGSLIGKPLEVDVDVEGIALAEYLRIKLKLDITKPLMRYIRVREDDDSDEEIEEVEESPQDGGQDGLKGVRLCDIKYEYLPIFCYNCGVIGHNDRLCQLPLKKFEDREYGKELRVPFPKRIDMDEDRVKISAGRSISPKSNSSGSGGMKQGSDAVSWRKDGSTKTSGVDGKEQDEGDDTDPLQQNKKDDTRGGSGKKLSFVDKMIEEGGQILDQKSVESFFKEKEVSYVNLADEENSNEKEAQERLKSANLSKDSGMKTNKIVGTVKEVKAAGDSRRDSEQRPMAENIYGGDKVLKPILKGKRSTFKRQECRVV